MLAQKGFCLGRIRSGAFLRSAGLLRLQRASNSFELALESGDQRGRSVDGTRAAEFFDYVAKRRHPIGPHYAAPAFERVRRAGQRVRIAARGRALQHGYSLVRIAKKRIDQFCHKAWLGAGLQRAEI